MKYLKILCFIFIAFFSFQKYLIAQWETQESGVKEDLYDFCFVDSMNGWILGTSTTILYTSDGGDNWLKQILPIDDTVLIAGIEFANSQKGFVFGENGLIIKTIDGGVTWVEQENEFNYDFSDLSFVNDSLGWLTGSLQTDQAREAVILHTIDGGNTWTEQLKIVSSQLFGSTIFNSIEFLNNSLGWACGGDYVDGFSETFIYHTTDKGNTWNNIGKVDGPIYELKIASANTIWCVGTGAFGISNDAGATWDYDSLYGYIYAVEPINSMESWIFESNHNKDIRRILFTIDGGNNWEQEMELESFIMEMDSYDKDYLWIVGEGGLIMRRRGNLTTVHQNNIIQYEFSLKQNYPNPFNPSTTISYSLPSESNVKIAIYDIMGRVVKTLASESKPMGSYKVTWDGTNSNGLRVSSGIYVCSFEAVALESNKHFVKSAKLMLVK